MTCPVALGRFAPPLDVRSVTYHLAGLLELAAPCLVVPAAIGVVAGELSHAAAFAGAGVAAFAIGWLGRRVSTPPLGQREALVTTALAYPMLALVAAVGYLPVAGPADAVFEALSGFTTTGLTVMSEETLPTSVAFFRSFSQWLGGAGIAIIYLAVLAGPRSAASRLYMADFEEGNVRGNVISAARAVAAVYGGLTLAGYAALLAAGAGPGDGLLHALSLLSTGGFSPFPDSIGAYESPAISAVTAVLMVLGATSLPLIYLLVTQRRWRQFVGDVQLRLMVGLLVVGTLVVFALDGGPFRALGGHVFHVTSALTTTGFVVGEPAAWAEGVKMATVGLMVVGGSAGSTAGGVKLLRLALFARLVWWVVVRTLLPREAHVPLHLRGVSVSEDDLRRTVAVAMCYAVLWFASALLLTGVANSAVDAAFEAASALGTVGQSVGITGPDLATGAKLVLGLDMWLGRIEILPVLLLLRPGRAAR